MESWFCFERKDVEGSYIHALSHHLKTFSNFLRYTLHVQRKLCLCVSAVTTTLQNLWLMGGGVLEDKGPTDVSIEAWRDRQDSCGFCHERRGAVRE